LVADMYYDEYNREERALCAHLFRLLHEGLATTPNSSGLAALLAILRRKRPDVALPPADDESAVRGAAILTEVALVRDAYVARKPDVADFMDALVRLVSEQEAASEVRLYSELPAPLNSPKLTHPKQIAQKGKAMGLLRSQHERRVYGAVQGMFNAKPDLAVVLPACLLVFEAKLTERFTRRQLDRTQSIAQVWTRVLFSDLGYKSPPPSTLLTIGDAREKPDVTWQELADVACGFYPEGDRTRAAMQAASGLLGRRS
jgi:hypothetical protein